MPYFALIIMFYHVTIACYHLTLADLRGLDPSLCTHRIFLEDESRLVREA